MQDNLSQISDYTNDETEGNFQQREMRIQYIIFLKEEFFSQFLCTKMRACDSISQMFVLFIIKIFVFLGTKIYKYSDV